MATLTVNIDKPPIPTGNTLWVDAVNGDDATGTAGRQDLPFLTLEEARDAATSGDTVVVRPGSYTTTTPLVKDGVNWHGELGATITGLSSGGANGIFNCLEAAVSFAVTGDFDIVQTISGSASETHAAVWTNNDDANVHVSCRSISCVADTDTPDSVYGVAGVKGTLTVDVQTKISLTGLLGVSAVYWERGPMYVRCPHIYSDFTAVNSYSGSGSTEFFVDGQLIESEDGSAINMGMGDPNLRTWITAQNVISRNGDTVITCGDSGKFYLQCEKISGGTTSSISFPIGALSNVEAWITTQKISSGSQFIQIGAGTLWLEVQEYEDTGGITTGIKVQDDTVGTAPPTLHIIGGRMELLTGNGIDIEAGALRAHGLTIDTSADDSSSPVVKSGGTLELNGCALIAEATQDSVTAPTAQSVIASGANTIYQAVNANVTVVGNMQEDTGIASAGEVPIAKADGTWEWGAVPDASETAKGIIEIATAAEVAALTDATRAVTSANLKSGALIDVTPAYITYSGGSIATTSTSLADLHASAAFTGLAPGFYIGEFFIWYNAAATTTGARFGMNGSVTQTYFTMICSYFTGNGDRSTGQTAVFDGGPAMSSSSGTTGNNAILQFSIQVTVAGDLLLRFATEVGGSAITVTSVIGFIRRVS
jgi:hypothetical protein